MSAPGTGGALAAAHDDAVTIGQRRGLAVRGQQSFHFVAKFAVASASLVEKRGLCGRRDFEAHFSWVLKDSWDADRRPAASKAPQITAVKRTDR